MRSGVAMVCSTLEISSHLSFTVFNISSLIYTFASLDTLCHNKVHVYFVSFIPFHLFRQVFCYNFIEQTWLLVSAHLFLQSHWAVGLNSQCCGQLMVSSHWYLKLLCLQSCSSSLVFCILLVESTGNWSHPGSLWFMKLFCYLYFHFFSEAQFPWCFPHIADNFIFIYLFSHLLHWNSPLHCWLSLLNSGLSQFVLCIYFYWSH